MSQAWDPAQYQSRHSYVFAYGQSLIDILQPRASEHIVDLGCGSGQLTAKIAESRAHVIGLDRSAEMITEARSNFPHLKFNVADAANFSVESPVDAVFSNAALHWVKNADGVAASVARALRPGGRFVVEMGGKGNVQAVIDALRQVAGPIVTPWYFPSVGEYTSLLERHNFKISFATLFDRPTRVDGEDGLEEWLAMFAGSMIAADGAKEVANLLRGKMFHDGGWTIDYRRLQIIATKGGT